VEFSINCKNRYTLHGKNEHLFCRELSQIIIFCSVTIWFFNITAAFSEVGNVSPKHCVGVLTDLPLLTDEN
jgi:hypothetical protein